MRPDMSSKDEAALASRAGSATEHDQSAFSFSPDIVMLSDPRGARAEAIRTLRTHIMAQHVYDGRRGLAVCAASAGVGASFVAVNLAFSLAQIGVKVLLIDGDMRTPQVDRFVQASSQVVGLRHYLGGETDDFSELFHNDIVENLSAVFAGRAAANAQELLASERFAELMGRCLRDYDITIVDTPAANSCADARRISTLVGYSLIVAKRHVSFVSDLKTLAGQLREDRAHVVGAVMNET